MRRLGATTSAVLDNPEMMALVLPAMRADLAVYERYRADPSGTIEAPVTALGGADDVDVTAEDLAACARRGFRIVRVSGGHFFHLAADSPALAEVLSGLDAARP